jgi:hypothetical protein
MSNKEKNIWGNNHQFNKTRIIYESLQLISTKKKKLIRDLVSYTHDPVRYQRRMRFLKEITKYELELLISFDNFKTNDPINDYDKNTLTKIENALDIITSINT